MRNDALGCVEDMYGVKIVAKTMNDKVSDQMRLPKPKAAAIGSWTDESELPSSKNRSGLN